MGSPAPFSVDTLVSALAAAGVELAAFGLICLVLQVLLHLLIFRPARARSGRLAEWAVALRVKTRNLLLVVVCLAAVVVLAFNGWLVWRGLDARAYTLELAAGLTADVWRTAAIVAGKVLLALTAAWLVMRVLRRATRAAENAINRWDQLKDNNRSLAKLFRGFDRMLGTIGGLLVAIFTAGLVGVSPVVTDVLVLALRIYAVFAIGLTIVRSTSVIVDTLDGLSRRFASSRGWLEYYERVRPLLPTLRACLEYAIWVGLASLIVVQLPPVRDLAVWGPRAIHAIALFFAGRVIVELGRMELSRRMLPSEGLDENERRRRATIVPLLVTAFTYAAYFGTGVLMLNALGRDPMPFLAGLGLLTVVIGFGAQALINDVVSGFFILFEDTYLVGEMIKVGDTDAYGVVEAIEFRTTKIRDDSGRLHIIRNGDMKPIINYSREYTNAVVDIVVGYDADLHAVFAALKRAAARVRANSPHVLAETEIEGVVTFTATKMTIRTQTRVKGGTQDLVAPELRFAIREEFAHDTGTMKRKRSRLVPRTDTAAAESRGDGAEGSASLAFSVE